MLFIMLTALVVCTFISRVLPEGEIVPEKAVPEREIVVKSPTETGIFLPVR